VRIVNDADGKALARYDLEEDFSVETAVSFGKIYKKDGEWRFSAIGEATRDKKLEELISNSIPNYI